MSDVELKDRIRKIQNNCYKVLNYNTKVDNNDKYVRYYIQEIIDECRFISYRLSTTCEQTSTGSWKEVEPVKFEGGLFYKLRNKLKGIFNGRTKKFK